MELKLIHGSAKNTGVGRGDRGLVGWLIDSFAALRARRLRMQMRTARQMSVVETLQLGGRRQLILVSCGTERYLVGCGADQVQTMVRVGVVEASADLRSHAEDA